VKKRWAVKPTDPQAVAALQKALGIHPVLCKLLLLRGIDTFEKAKAFFRPTLDQLHDPWRMKDMDKAVQRLEQAIAKEEQILVYGDYDVDGTTAIALVYAFLNTFYPNVHFYVPDRNKEGYGISFIGIDRAAANGCTLVIALDCGITAVEQMDYARSKGIDFIICDHHQPKAQLPEAVAVLDPKREDCHYPYDELSGCGIGFKLIQAFAERNNIPFEVVAGHLDLVTISIASDIVPITGENRVLAYFGLKKINTDPRAGVAALTKVSGLKKPLSVTNLVFGIGPRINAAGRMAHARHAVELRQKRRRGAAPCQTPA